MDAYVAELVTSTHRNGVVVASVDATRLSQLLSSLADATATAQWVAARSAQCTSILPELLVAIVNGAAVSAKLRFSALACLVALSKVPDEMYRRELLFPHIASLDASFESLLVDREDAAKEFGTQLGKQHEHMILLLFRCAGYQNIKAVDLLFDLCNGNDVLLVQLLVAIIKVRSHEWPLIAAAFRCIMELTYPSTYFSASSPASFAPASSSSSSTDRTIQVSDFQSKIVTIVVHGMQGNLFKTLAEELSDRWALLSRAGGDAALLSAHGAVDGPLLVAWFARALHALNTTILNLDLYNEQVALQRNLQQSLLVQLSSAMASLWLGFPKWVVETCPHLLQGHQGVLRAVVSCLQVARMALYKPNRGVVPHVCVALGLLTEACAMQIPHLKGAGGITVLQYAIQMLVNVNALQRVEAVGIATGSLAGACQTLLATVAADSSVRLAGGASLSQTLSTLYVSERSHYVATENETSRAVTNGLCGAALDELVDEIMDFIDSELSRLGLGGGSSAAVGQIDPSSGELGLVPEVAAVPAPHAIEEWVEMGDLSAPATSSTVLSQGASEPSASKTKKKKSKHRRSVHPPEYLCALTGKLMREPVQIRSTGRWFEWEALEHMMETMGHVDPVGGEYFDEDPEVDALKQKEIQRYLVKHNSKKRSAEDEME